MQLKIVWNTINKQVNIWRMFEQSWQPFALAMTRQIAPESRL